MESEDDSREQPSKRRKTTGRRKAACHSCSLRKIRCNNERPTCAQCQSTGSNCVYSSEPDDALTLNRVVEILSSQIDDLSNKVDNYAASSDTQLPMRSSQQTSRVHLPLEHSNDSDTHFSVNHIITQQPQPSRDFAHIPPHRTTADEVLIWPIFDGAFPSNYLIDPHLGYKLSSGGAFDDSEQADILQISHDVAPLDEQRIPALVDKFLENVHTKNPILDVENLVRKSREYASKGLAWDGYSCLLLMACALGLVAKSFGSETEALESHMSIEDARQISAPSKERSQADNCFVQGSRRLGSLRPSVLASQCYFFAGVYLMYTLRPMLSWQYFHQASIAYQLYLKMCGRILDDNSVTIKHPSHIGSASSRMTRLEQRLYWSLFKSEAEFRVELPLPQSEIAEYEFPNLFPSPPSPATGDDNSIAGSVRSPISERGPSTYPHISKILSPVGPDEITLHAKRLCNEEESWYYYLTEVALRRIGNRVINTFFRLDKSEWLKIEGLLDVAMEFEAQVSTWQTNLPPAMQKYETNSSIRAPRIVSPGGAEAGFVSQELSWATENRLLEMRHWLYQPFLYYLVHARPSPPPTAVSRNNSLSSAAGVDGTDQNVFWTLINRAIDCNLTILETRTVPHRHHGLWFDLRAIICSSLILLAVVKSGYAQLLPGGVASLVGAPEEALVISDAAPNAEPRPGSILQTGIRGKFGRVLRQLEIWSHESSDMVRSREVLEMLIYQILGLR